MMYIVVFGATLVLIPYSIYKKAYETWLPALIVAFLFSLIGIMILINTPMIS